MKRLFFTVIFLVGYANNYCVHNQFSENWSDLERNGEVKCLSGKLLRSKSDLGKQTLLKQVILNNLVQSNLGQVNLTKEELKKQEKILHNIRKANSSPNLQDKN